MPLRAMTSSISYWSSVCPGAISRIRSADSIVALPAAQFRRGRAARTGLAAELPPRTLRWLGRTATRHDCDLHAHVVLAPGRDRPLDQRPAGALRIVLAQHRRELVLDDRGMDPVAALQ